MNNRTRNRVKQARDDRASPRLGTSPETNATSDAAQVDAIPSASARLARLYLPPLARLFDLLADLDERPSMDFAGWKAGLKSVVHALKNEELRLQVVERSTRMALRSRGGHRRVIADAMTELAVQAAASYDPEARVKDQMQRLLLVAVERSMIFGIDLPPVDVSEEEECILKKYVEDTRNQKPGCRRSGRGSGSRAISAYIAPIQGLAHALERSDFIEVERECERVSLHVIERIERRTAELDAINCRGHALSASQRIKLARLYSDLALESMRVKLIDIAVAGILRCFGGTQRTAMELAYRETVESAAPTDPRVKEILDRVSTDVMKRGAAKRPQDQ